MSNYSDGVSRKSRKTALILCIVFKEIGIHDFYLGKIIQGLGHLAIFVVAVLFVLADAFSPSYSSAGEAMTYLVTIPNIIWTIFELVSIASGKMSDGEGKLVTLWNPDEYPEETFSEENSSSTENSSVSDFNSNMSFETPNNIEHIADEPRWTCKKCGNIMNYESVSNCSICGEKKTE